MKDIDEVFHLAALIGIPYSYEAPLSYVRTNIVGTVNILEAARKNDTELVVNTSTSETYGSALYTPIDELHPLQGQSPYSASKISADKLAESYCNSFKTPVLTIRPFNTFGPRQSLRAIIPTIISQLVSGKKYIKLGNINTHRDFTFVEDTCSALYCLMMAKKTKGEIFNIGSQNVYSIKETLDIIQKKLNTSCKIILDKKRIRPENSEVFLLSADYKKLKKLTKYKPKYNFKKGIEKTINWFLKNENFIKSANKYHI